MNTLKSDWEMVRDLLGDALDQPAAVRESFVQNATGIAPHLRARVLELLEFAATTERDAEFLEPMNAQPEPALVSLLRIPKALRTEILQQSAEARPHEACGVLLGRRHGDGTAAVEAHHDARNRAATPDAFEIHPADWILAWREAADQGRELVGVWHSHPGTAPTPSPSDRDAAWPEYVYLIAGLSPDGGWQLRCWQRRGPEMAEVPIQIVP